MDFLSKRQRSADFRTLELGSGVGIGGREDLEECVPRGGIRVAGAKLPRERSRWQDKRSATADQAEQRLTAFAAKWDSRYAPIAALWRRQWQQVIPFFAFPAEIRKVIYTTNAVESLNMSLRKALKPRVAFPSEDAALKVMYLALRNVIRKWDKSIHWKAALNCFTVLWEDRIQAAIGK
jgi:hypothetical protein